MSTVDNPEPKAAPQGLWRCQTGGVTVVIGNIGMTGEMAVAEAGATSAIRLIAAQSHHSRTAPEKSFLKPQKASWRPHRKRQQPFARKSPSVQLPNPVAIPLPGRPPLRFSRCFGHARDAA